MTFIDGFVFGLFAGIMLAVVWEWVLKAVQETIETLGD